MWNRQINILIYLIYVSFIYSIIYVFYLIYGSVRCAEIQGKGEGLEIETCHLSNAVQTGLDSITRITEPSSEKHEEKISNMISYTAKVKCKSWLERDLNAIQARMCSVSILLQNHPQRNMKRKFLTWFLTLPKSSVKVDSSETWTLSKRGCAVFRFYYRTILRETWRENF